MNQLTIKLIILLILKKMKNLDIIFKDITFCSEKQIKEIREIRNLENIRKFMFTDHYISKKEHLNYITKLKDDKKNLVFIIFNNLSEIIGLLSLNSINKFHKKADWAFYTSPKINNIGGIIEYHFIEFFFNKLNFEKLNCEVLENNISTQKLHEKFLFKKEGIKKEKIVKNNKEIDVYLYGLTKRNWYEGKFLLSKFESFFNKYNIKFEFDKKFIT